MREIRTLRAMWRALEPEPRQFLPGHEEGNLGYTPRRSLRATAPALDPTRGLVTYYVLFFIHLESRNVSIAGITDHPEAYWMRQVACNATFDWMGHLNGCRYLLHDRDAKFCPEFRGTLAAGGVKCLRLPPRSPNLNAFAERWVRSVKEECLIPSLSGI